MLGRLDDVAAGKDRPKDVAERLEFAEVFYAKQRHADAVDQYAAAIAEKPSIAQALDGHQYNAACNASLAAAQGAKDPAGLRARALAWLRADLTAWGRVEKGRRDTLGAWRSDPDLAAVRDGIETLPESERAAWRAVWSDVNALLWKGP